LVAAKSGGPTFKCASASRRRIDTPGVKLPTRSRNGRYALGLEIQAAFPKCRWSKMASKYVVEEVGLIATWEIVETYLEDQEGSAVQGLLLKSSPH
jgi:hypothetical protein